MEEWRRRYEIHKGVQMDRARYVMGKWGGGLRGRMGKLGKGGAAASADASADAGGGGGSRRKRNVTNNIEEATVIEGARAASAGAPLLNPLRS
eukprot:1020321-Prorocentrum_minimum.AAC.1